MSRLPWIDVFEPIMGYSAMLPTPAMGRVRPYRKPKRVNPKAAAQKRRKLARRINRK